MTEWQWKRSSNPVRMLTWLETSTAERPLLQRATAMLIGWQAPPRRILDDRKRLLFDAACGRRIWDQLSPSNRRVIEAEEEAAEGRLTMDQLLEIRLLASPIVSTGSSLSGSDARYLALAPFAFDCLRLIRENERQGQASLLREVIGNPFQLVNLPSTFRVAETQELAEYAYQDRELSSGRLNSSRLAVLADALEESGCTDEAILSHLRSPGPHVRGCWALDLLLERE